MGGPDVDTRKQLGGHLPTNRPLNCRVPRGNIAEAFEQVN